MWHPFQKGSDQLQMNSRVNGGDGEGVEEAADPVDDGCLSTLSELSDGSVIRLFL
jgi:hypothetical protein